jgi:adenosylcobinamide-GDP ribazoletransferase
MSTLSDLRAAVAFLPPLGAPRAAPSPETMTYFPAVGAALGSVVGWTWLLARRRLEPLPAATLAVAADALLTGALHLDGLTDAADGLCAHAPARSRLEIMAEPQIGTFGAVALGTSLITRTAALACMEPSPALLGAIYCSSRAVMVVGSRSLTYLRSDGLATAFLPRHGSQDASLIAGVVGAVAALALASVVDGRRGAAALLTGWGAGALVLEISRRRLGGFTGDVLGAAGALSEVAALVVATTKTSTK